MSSRTERRVSVRLVATGGQALKAELVGIGQEGARALTLIEAAGPRAAAGLNAAGVSAGEAMRQMQDLADRAARAASHEHREPFDRRFGRHGARCGRCGCLWPGPR
jgi:hypothetical protein